MKIIILLIILQHCFLNADEYDYKKIMNQYQYMTIAKALSHWKILKSDLLKTSTTDFKKIKSEKEQTQYLIYLVDKKKFIGKNRSAVIDELGEPSSYFFSEQNATYSLLKNDVNQWVVSFEVSSDQIVRSAKIAKKCCYEVK